MIKHFLAGLTGLLIALICVQLVLMATGKPMKMLFDPLIIIIIVVIAIPIYFLTRNRF